MTEPLKWIRQDRYYVEDSTKRYRVSAQKVNGDHYVFTAWKGQKSIGYGTSEECKRLCEEDSLKPEPKTSKNVALEAIANAKELIRLGKEKDQEREAIQNESNP